jgi:hypothetical protein
MGYPNLTFLPKHRLLEIDREVVAEIVPLLGTAATLLTCSACGTTEAAEEGFEQIGETAHVTHVGHAGGTTESRLSELVVTTPCLRIAEHFIGTTDLFETVFSPRLFVDIRVVLASQTAVSALKSVSVGIPADTEKLVIIGHQLEIPKVTVRGGV